MWTAPATMTDLTPRSTLDLTGQITALIARSKALDPNTIHPSTSFDDLEIDSLDKINLTFEIEEIYAIQIPDDSLNSLRTVGDVVTGVQRLLAEKSQRQPAETSQRQKAEESQRQPAERSQRQPAERSQRQPAAKSQRQP